MKVTSLAVSFVVLEAPSGAVEAMRVWGDEAEGKSDDDAPRVPAPSASSSSRDTQLLVHHPIDTPASPSPTTTSDRRHPSPVPSPDIVEALVEPSHATTTSSRSAPPRPSIDVSLSPKLIWSPSPRPVGPLYWSVDGGRLSQCSTPLHTYDDATDAFLIHSNTNTPISSSLHRTRQHDRAGLDPMRGTSYILPDSELPRRRNPGECMRLTQEALQHASGHSFSVIHDAYLTHAY